MKAVKGVPLAGTSQYDYGHPNGVEKKMNRKSGFSNVHQYGDIRCWSLGKLVPPATEEQHTLAQTRLGKALIVRQWFEGGFKIPRKENPLDRWAVDSTWVHCWRLKTACLDLVLPTGLGCLFSYVKW